MAAVDLIHVNKIIDKNHVLKDVSLNIEKGEFVSVVGPSGCGKSSLLRLVAGLDSLSSGKILINNECVNKMPASKRDIAMVFQSYALYPHMSVFDNMAYGLKMRKYSKEDIKKRVHDAAALLKLEPYLLRKPQELSGGQRQRVAMGRAMVRSPAIFLFDEPLSNLDAKLRTEMRHEIKKLHQQLKTTFLYVTHDQTEAMTMADRIVVLNQGRVEQIGSPRALYERPASVFVAGFTGHYPMNFISAIISDKACVSLGANVSYHLPYELPGFARGDKMLMAVRSEHLLLAATDDNNYFKLKIDYIDNMGADILIQGTEVMSGTRLCVRAKADWQPQGEFVYVGIPQQNVHFFDERTGLRIGVTE